MNTRVTELLGIKYPILSGGMVWCSGWRLASEVSLCGGLGLIGAGSMHPEVLEEHIVKCREAVGDLPFGVNIPLFYPELERIMQIVEQYSVPVVVTSGGSPALYTQRLKASGAKVLHVVASTKFAQKAESAGVDGIICEGFEAGGHNGRDETTTMVLTPLVVASTSLPVIAAGGIATGEQFAAAVALGAEGIQIGSRFALSLESSASDIFKDRCYGLPEGDTMLTLKELSPVRLVKNSFFSSVQELYSRGTTKEELSELLGRGRAKLAIFEGDIDNGEVEIGQVASLITSKQSVREIVDEILESYKRCLERLVNLD